jgi:hypothetical protein
MLHGTSKLDEFSETTESLENWHEICNTEFWSLYRAGKLKTAASELAKCKLDLVGIKEFRWVECGIQPAEYFTFSFENGKANHHLGTGFFVYKGIRSGIKGVEFISEGMSYIFKLTIRSEIFMKLAR